MDLLNKNCMFLCAPSSSGCTASTCITLLTLSDETPPATGRGSFGRIAKMILSSDGVCPSYIENWKPDNMSYGVTSTSAVTTDISPAVPVAIEVRR
jgi:hypothetical protein